MSEWKPIAEIPRDSSRVLIFVPNAWGERDEIHVGYCSQNGLMVIGGVFSFDIGKPTHWMPLPAPPDALAAEKAADRYVVAEPCRPAVSNPPLYGMRPGRGS